MVLGALKRMSFFNVLINTLWTFATFMVVLAMKGKVAPAISIGIFDQLRQLKDLIANMISVNDLAQQKIPEYKQVRKVLPFEELGFLVSNNPVIFHDKWNRNNCLLNSHSSTFTMSIIIWFLP